MWNAITKIRNNFLKRKGWLNSSNNKSKLISYSNDVRSNKLSEFGERIYAFVIVLFESKNRVSNIESISEKDKGMNSAEKKN